MRAWLTTTLYIIYTTIIDDSYPSATSLSLNLAEPKDAKATKHAIVICKTFLNGVFLLYILKYIRVVVGVVYG